VFNHIFLVQKETKGYRNANKINLLLFQLINSDTSNLIKEDWSITNAIWCELIVTIAVVMSITNDPL